jgi:adenine-specific DNA-methyltransferase
MDYIETVTAERVKKVIQLNQEGSFVYTELMKYNQKYVDIIQNANSKDEIVSLWNLMQDNAFLSYQFDKKTFNERLDAFKTASIDDMKQYLLEVIDKNQLYVNRSNLEDELFNCSEEEKKVTNDFYQLKK